MSVGRWSESPTGEGEVLSQGGSKVASHGGPTLQKLDMLDLELANT